MKRGEIIHKGRKNVQVSKCVQKIKILMAGKFTHTNLERSKTNPEFGNTLLIFQ